MSNSSVVMYSPAGDLIERTGEIRFIGSKGAWTAVFKDRPVLEGEPTIMPGAVLNRVPKTNGNTQRPLAENLQPVKMGADCIIGANAVVYAGVTLGDRVMINDLSSVREGCTLGDYVVLGRGVMVLTDTTIGARTRIMDLACLGTCVVEEDVFIAHGVLVALDKAVYLSRFNIVPCDLRPVIIRKRALIGAGAILLPGIEIGEGAVVGSGSVVTHSVPAYHIAMGVPARDCGEVDAKARLAVEGETWLQTVQP